MFLLSLYSLRTLFGTPVSSYFEFKFHRKKKSSKVYAHLKIFTLFCDLNIIIFFKYAYHTLPRAKIHLKKQIIVYFNVHYIVLSALFK